MIKNTSPDRVAVEEGIVVGDGGGRALKADVFLPPAPVANGAGVLLVHGGGWTSGDRSQLRGYGILLGRAGYASVACEYRLAPDAKWPAQLDDVRAAFDWFRAHAAELNVDHARLAVEGNSAGAHLALMLAATASGQLGACIAIYPPTDLTGSARVSDAIRARHAELAATGADVTLQLFGFDDAGVREQASPIRYASAAFPPTMLIHGNADEIVDVRNSQRMYQALVDAGAKAELHIFDGQLHAFDRAPGHGRQCAALMSLFLSRHLAPPPVAAK